MNADIQGDRIEVTTGAKAPVRFGAVTRPLRAALPRCCTRRLRVIPRN